MCFQATREVLNDCGKEDDDEDNDDDEEKEDKVLKEVNRKEIMIVIVFIK